MPVAAPGQLASCVHCGLCLASCPTYVTLGTEADSPRGRIHLLRALEEGEIAPGAEVRRHVDGCLGCRACETACPSGVPFGGLIEAARPLLERHRPVAARTARRLLAAVLTQPVLGHLALAPARWLGGRAWITRVAARLPLRAVAYLAALPRWRRRERLPAVLEPDGAARGTALLVPGCVADRLFGETTRHMAHLLRYAGLRVIVPREALCCGALRLHLGDAAGARRQAEALLARVEPSRADWVVTTAAGCGALVREYECLLPGNIAARHAARRGRDALALLAEVGLPAPRNALPRTVAVHDPCHLAHGQGVRAQVRALLAAIPAVRLVDLAESDWCCGSAGSYNLTQPAMAARIAERKIDRIIESAAEVVAAANPGCLLQIRAAARARGLGVAVEHPIDLLAAAHGLAD